MTCSIPVTAACHLIPASPQLRPFGIGVPVLHSAPVVASVTSAQSSRIHTGIRCFARDGGCSHILTQHFSVSLLLLIAPAC